VYPAHRWLREASQVVGHAAHALGHLSEQAPKAVQALEKVGTGIERLLQVQQLRSQQVGSRQQPSELFPFATETLVRGGGVTWVEHVPYDTTQLLLCSCWR
jgi:hypothetical protein